MKFHEFNSPVGKIAIRRDDIYAVYEYDFNGVLLTRMQTRDGTDDFNLSDSYEDVMKEING